MGKTQAWLKKRDVWKSQHFETSNQMYKVIKKYSQSICPSDFCEHTEGYLKGQFTRTTGRHRPTLTRRKKFF